MDRNIVYAFPTPYGTTNVVNYSGKSEVNSFIAKFDVWGCGGHQKLCFDGSHSAFWFECSKLFFEMLHEEDFARAFQLMSVRLTFDGNDVMDID